MERQGMVTTPARAARRAERVDRPRPPADGARDARDMARMAAGVTARAARRPLTLDMLLLTRGAIDTATVARAQAAQRDLDLPLGDILLARGAISEAELLSALSEHYDMGIPADLTATPGEFFSRGWPRAVLAPGPIAGPWRLRSGFEIQAGSGPARVGRSATGRPTGGPGPILFRGRRWGNAGARRNRAVDGALRPACRRFTGPPTGNSRGLLRGNGSGGGPGALGPGKGKAPQSQKLPGALGGAPGSRRVRALGGLFEINALVPAGGLAGGDPWAPVATFGRPVAIRAFRGWLVFAANTQP